jgi:endonuclease/exonuclease/phosphatase family metal-dependent hydrolase
VGEIQGSKADVIGLVEDVVHYPDPVTYWRRKFPEYSVQVAGGGLVILARGELQAIQYHRIGRRSRCATAVLTLDSRRIRVALVDIEGSPFVRRDRVLQSVEEIVGLFPESATMILGDFNTPGDSMWFRRIRDSYINAFESAGQGMRPTWPSVLPLLTLDHIWVSPHLQPVCTKKKTSLVSDHSQLWSDLSWRKGLLFPGVGGRDSSPPLPPVLG